MRRGLVAAAAVALAIAAVAVNAVLLQRDYAFVDLEVYRWAALAAFDRGDLYAAAQPGTGLRFTYPPPALLLFAALEAVELLGRRTFTVLSILLLARASWLLAGAAQGTLATAPRPLLALGLTGAALAVEPGHSTVLLGQVSFLLLWLGAEGLVGPLRARAVGGLPIGLAVALRLTPGTWLLLQLATRQWRAFLAAVATVLASAGAAWIVLPTESRSFWLGAGTDVDRVGDPEYAPNQSIQGVLWRLLGPGGNDLAWALLAVAALAACLVVARRYDEAGNHVAGFGLAGLASVLASPVSWTHHWVLAMPLVVALLDIRTDGAARRGEWVAAGVALVAGAVFASRAVWRVPQGGGLEFDHSPLQLLASSSYVLVGVALLGAAWLARPRTVAG